MVKKWSCGAEEFELLVCLAENKNLDIESGTGCCWQQWDYDFSGEYHASSTCISVT
ncbi:MAG: hypothetical protein U5K84_12515 [Alkalibacterium sp.]|nr:hypothetical protein [Alkalibacterium sp.]